MADVVITGGGVAGLTTAMLLAGDGHEVTVLERDPAPPPAPAQAWDSWERRGVNQFRLLHFFQPRMRIELERELPHVARALGDAGAARFNPIADAPVELTGGFRPSDADHEVLTGRRPVVESVLAAAAEATPGLTVRRGVAVQGLLTGAESAPGVPHARGVRTTDGEDIGAQLVVDAGGRRSALGDWVEAAGGRRPPEEREDLGFVYYGVHFRSDDGSTPPPLGPLLQAYGTISVLTLPADNGTWGVGLIASSRDRAMRALTDLERWTAVVRSLPLAAHWAEGERLDDRVAVMAKIEDRHRDFVVDGTPVATGIAAVGDAWACTNPSVGRGASMAFLHALALRDVVRKTPLDDPLGFAAAWAEATEGSVEPWYRATLSFDRHRLAEIDAGIRGEPYVPDGPEWDFTQGLFLAAGQDPDCLRGALSIGGMLSLPDEVFADPAIVEKVVTLGGGWRDAPALGPSRQELLEVLA